MNSQMNTSSASAHAQEEDEVWQMRLRTALKSLHTLEQDVKAHTTNLLNDADRKTEAALLKKLTD